MQSQYLLYIAVIYSVFCQTVVILGLWWWGPWMLLSRVQQSVDLALHSPHAYLNHPLHSVVVKSGERRDECLIWEPKRYAFSFSLAKKPHNRIVKTCLANVLNINSININRININSININSLMFHNSHWLYLHVVLPSICTFWCASCTVFWIFMKAMLNELRQLFCHLTDAILGAHH